MNHHLNVKSPDLAEELLDHELELIDLAISSRRSHLKNVDHLEHRGLAPKSRRVCPTGKRKFKDKKEADRVLHLIMNNRKDAEADGKHYRFKQFRSYMCPCGYAHHSSKPDLFPVEALNVA